MKREIAEKLVNALESGDYTQGFGALRIDNCFCVHGVLCDLAVKEGIIPEPVSCVSSISARTIYSYGVSPCFSNAISPRIVESWAELNDFDFKLSRLNDNGMPFSELASMIRQRYLS